MPGLSTPESHPELRTLQNWMLDSLLAPKLTSPQSVDETLLPGGQLDAAGCLAIYQRSYRLRLRKCLGEQFPATLNALGEELFYDFVDEYLRDCPSESYTLYDLGRRFPAWLERTRPDSHMPGAERESWIDFMVDLAHYEFTLFRLFDAPGHEDGPWPHPTCDDSSLVLQPCLALAEYRFPVAAYYHAVRDRRAPELPPLATSCVVVLRRNYRTITYPVSAFHFRFLLKLQERGDVSAALEEIAEGSGRPLAEVHQSWRREVKTPWIEAGFFVQRLQDR